MVVIKRRDSGARSGRNIALMLNRIMLRFQDAQLEAGFRAAEDGKCVRVLRLGTLAGAGLLLMMGVALDLFTPASVWVGYEIFHLGAMGYGIVLLFVGFAFTFAPQVRRHPQVAVALLCIFFALSVPFWLRLLPPEFVTQRGFMLLMLHLFSIYSLLRLRLVPAAMAGSVSVVGYGVLLFVLDLVAPAALARHLFWLTVVNLWGILICYQLDLSVRREFVATLNNVRLLNETKEALERQTATAEILKVIAGSPSDVQPVLDAIVASARQLVGGFSAMVTRVVGDTLHLAAFTATDDAGAQALKSYFPRPVGSESLIEQMLRTAVPLLIEDTETDATVSTTMREMARKRGYRSMLMVPLIRDSVPIGTISVTRSAPGRFPSHQVDLLQTFADQAVIAIENARQFREIVEKGRQLEEASQHKSQFLASMSHELRTPLNAILGFNEMLLDQSYGEVPVDMKEPLEDIQKSGKHLLRLINNVLDLAKIEAGRMELALADYSVHDTVESVRSTLRPLAAEKGLEFIATLPDDLPLAYGDFGRITQCLMNLAGNSLKFTKAGKVEISVELQGDTLVYKVSDTGIGIPPDKIGNLFTEFKQTDATIASEYGGTGLGLSISKKFIEMHGGRIWVESELGKGSAFIFQVPLRTEAVTV